MEQAIRYAMEQARKADAVSWRDHRDTAHATFATTLCAYLQSQPETKAIGDELWKTFVGASESNYARYVGEFLIKIGE